MYVSVKNEDSVKNLSSWKLLERKARAQFILNPK
jgi:hypothetical protein